MTSDAGFNSQDTDYARHIQEVLDELRQMQQSPQLVTSPAELEAFEREIRQRTDRLGSLFVMDCNRNAPGLQSAHFQDHILCIYPCPQDHIICL